MAPKSRAHAHRGHGGPRKGVVYLPLYRAIGFLHSVTLGLLRVPACCGHAPEPLVHVHKGIQSFGAGLAHGLPKGVCALTRRQVLRKVDIVGATMPPVPEYTDRHAEIV